MDYNKNLLITGLIVYFLGLFLIFTGILIFVAGPFSSYGIGGFWLIIPGYFLISTGNALRKRARSRQPDQNKTPGRVEQKTTYSYEYEKKETTRCPKCDGDNPVNATNCANCGTKLTGMKKCEMCGKLNNSDSKFCRNCGHDFELGN